MPPPEQQTAQSPVAGGVASVAGAAPGDGFPKGQGTSFMTDVVVESSMTAPRFSSVGRSPLLPEWRNTLALLIHIPACARADDRVTRGIAPRRSARRAPPGSCPGAVGPVFNIFGAP